MITQNRVITLYLTEMWRTMNVQANMSVYVNLKKSLFSRNPTITLSNRDPAKHLTECDWTVIYPQE